LTSGTPQISGSPTADSPLRPLEPDRPGDLAAMATTAVLLATAPADDGRPAATLAWGDGTVLSRLVAQLVELGVRTRS